VGRWDGGTVGRWDGGTVGRWDGGLARSCKLGYVKQREMSAGFQQLLEQAKPRVEQLCRELAVEELRLFGSAASDAFDPASSDVDLVVDFRDHDAPGISDRYFSLAEGLEKIFERPVDLVTTRAIKNPYFRRIVDETSRLIYAA